MNYEGGIKMNSLWSTRRDIPLIDRVRIQAEVLVPLMHAMSAELGEMRANEILRQTLSPMFREVGRRYYESANHSAEEAMQAYSAESAAGDAIAYDMRFSGDVTEADITSCQYAKFFHELGEPELGFLFVCSSDFGVFDEIAGVEMKRTQTIMQGASHCDFRFKLTAKSSTTT
jgi:predicted ArsR family transcriptional regulator